MPFIFLFDCDFRQVEENVSWVALCGRGRWSSTATCLCQRHECNLVPVCSAKLYKHTHLCFCFNPCLFPCTCSGTCNPTCSRGCWVLGCGVEQDWCTQANPSILNPWGWGTCTFFFFFSRRLKSSYAAELLNFTAFFFQPQVWIAYS